MNIKKFYNPKFSDGIKSKSIVIVANIIDQCNQSCYYCFNTFPRTLKLLDLNKLYNFINYVYKNKYKNIDLILLGGEPTLHPGLLEFCEKIQKQKYINYKVISNFSANISVYKKLLINNNNLQLSWHSLINDKYNKKFLKKIKLFDNYYFNNNNINITVMYEKAFYKESLYVFNLLKNNYLKNVEFSLVQSPYYKMDTELYLYTNEQIKLYNDIVYNDKKYINIKNNNFIINTFDKKQLNIIEFKVLDLKYKLRNFKLFKCMAGVDEFYVNFNGDIAPCEDMYFKYNIKYGNLNYDYKIKFKKFTICKLENCGCPFFSMKERIFKN